MPNKKQIIFTSIVVLATTLLLIGTARAQTAVNDNGESTKSTMASATTEAEVISDGGAVILPTIITPIEAAEEEKKEEVPVPVTAEELAEITIPTLEKPVAQMTIAELQAKIAEFLTAIQQLQTLLAQITEVSGIPADYKFEKTLKSGQTSNDVKYLQIFLNSDPETQIAKSGPGSPGNETTYFGPLTKAAVIKFQEKYAEDILAPWNLTEGTGLVGKTTRDKINSLLGR